MAKKKTATATTDSSTPTMLLHLGTTVQVTFGIPNGGDVTVLDPLVLTVSQLRPEAFTELLAKIEEQRDIKIAALNAG